MAAAIKREAGDRWGIRDLRAHPLPWQRITLAFYHLAATLPPAVRARKLAQRPPGDVEYPGRRRRRPAKGDPE
jgi:hypothetical protein